MKHSKKILLVSTGGYIGGEETFTRDLAIELLKRGHQVWVAPGGAVQREDLAQNHIPIADLAISGRSMSGFIKGAREINGFVEAHNIDIIHCQAVGPVIMGAFSRWLHLPSAKRFWVWHEHGISSATYRWISFFCRNLHYILTVSDYERIKLLDTSGTLGEKIRRIHNGIDPRKWTLAAEQRAQYRAEVRRKYGIPENVRVWGYVGRLSPEKGCDIFVPSAIRILKKNPSAYFMIVGNGVMEQQLQRAASEAGILNNICFCGFQDEVPKYMAALDILIQPSKMDAFSLTVTQALAMGIPVVAADVGGIPEQMAHNYNGILFESGDIDGLASAVNRLFAEPDYGEKLANVGKKIVARYLNIERMVNQIEEIYDFAEETE